MGETSTPAPIVAVLGLVFIDECGTAIVSRLDEPRLPTIFSRDSEGRVPFIGFYVVLYRR